MKGIILSGGSGTRLYPNTKGVSKQLLPIYDKPMIYYPMSVLMMGYIDDILIITTNEDAESFKRLLGDGSQFGIKLQYAVQEKPEGLAQAFLIAEECGFTDGTEPLCLILGDNVFHCPNFEEYIIDAISTSTFSDDVKENSAMVFGYYVKDPERYGVAEFNEYGECISIEEKPKNPKSNYAVVGLYFYPGDVVEKAKTIKPSKRGELEITTLNQLYLDEGRLKIERMPKGSAWLDCGTFDSMLEASNYVSTIEKRQGKHIACLEEIAWENEWITDDKLTEIGEQMKNNSYGQYILGLLAEN